MVVRRIAVNARRESRRGTAAVEFAVIAPVFLLLVLGTWEMGSATKASNNLTAAVREGGRLASMDFTQSLAPNQTANAKVIQDIRAFLTAAGMPGSQATITITYADGAQAGQTFDLGDANNYLGLYRIKATIPFSAISVFPNRIMKNTVLKAELVNRRGRVSTAQ